MARKSTSSVYSQIIAEIFQRHYQAGLQEFSFDRSEVGAVAVELGVFTGLSCYSLQSHLRTTVQGIGQVETDEVYIGLDKRGVHFILPVQAKGKSDRIGQVQIEQDLALCAEKFPSLICRPIAAQFMAEQSGSGSADSVSDADLALYRQYV